MIDRGNRAARPRNVRRVDAARAAARLTAGTALVFYLVLGAVPSVSAAPPEHAAAEHGWTLASAHGAREQQVTTPEETLEAGEPTAGDATLTGEAAPTTTEPELTEPELTEPDLTEPELTEPGSTEPGDDGIVADIDTTESDDPIAAVTNPTGAASSLAETTPELSPEPIASEASLDGSSDARTSAPTVAAPVPSLRPVAPTVPAALSGGVAPIQGEDWVTLESRRAGPASSAVTHGPARPQAKVQLAVALDAREPLARPWLFHAVAPTGAELSDRGLLRVAREAAIPGAGLLIGAPQVPGAVAVAVEFGRAGHGWAGVLVFNTWLRRELRERRMTQRQLAVLSGVNHSTISRLLADGRSPSLETATKLAHALRLRWSDDEVAAYFDLLSERKILPTNRVEMALRGDDELSDEDVRALMHDYLMRRARRRHARTRAVDNGRRG